MDQSSPAERRFDVNVTTREMADGTYCKQVQVVIHGGTDRDGSVRREAEDTIEALVASLRHQASAHAPSAVETEETWACVECGHPHSFKPEVGADCYGCGQEAEFAMCIGARA